VRAAVSTSTDSWLTVEDVPDPVPEPGDVVLRVDACGICGSDLHMAELLRDHPGGSGTIFGHEFSGTVVAMGADVDGYREGDRVVGFPLAGCRHCAACRRGAVAKCRSALLTGAQRPGAYAEYVAVGAAESFLLPEPLEDVGALIASRLRCGRGRSVPGR
jgi:(R,R)-butanediol dehydrogenase/meso-butanediol dehydrogenase/diacetyl reductase